MVTGKENKLYIIFGIIQERFDLGPVRFKGENDEWRIFPFAIS
jgi:hypothetical protein